MTKQSFGVLLISDERNRQIRKWGPDHDRGHDNSELAKVAAALCANASGVVIDRSNVPEWYLKYEKEGRVIQLQIAGALIAAEIDRLSSGYGSQKTGE